MKQLEAVEDFYNWGTFAFYRFAAIEHYVLFQSVLFIGVHRPYSNLNSFLYLVVKGYIIWPLNTLQIMLNVIKICGLSTYQQWLDQGVNGNSCPSSLQLSWTMWFVIMNYAQENTVNRRTWHHNYNYNYNFKI